MKERSRNILSLVLILALVVTSINVYGIQSKAEATLDLSKVSTEKVITSGDPTFNITAATRIIDGVEYNNYAKFEGISALATSEINGDSSAKKAIDGSTGSRWESVHNVDPQTVTVDFGNVYNLKVISIFWEGASAKVYDIEVSQDGIVFEKLCTVENTSGRRTDEITLAEEISVRAVRINGKSRTTIYGYSIYEMGFYGASPQGEVVPVMSNLQVKDYYKYTGKYLIYFNEPAESAGYNVYVDDISKPIKQITNSGAYLTAKDLEGIAEGEHTLYVANVSESGKESAKLSTKFTISDTVGTYTDIPQIYIYTTSSINTDYHDDNDVTISVVDKDGGEYADLFDTECNIKIRGNTTASAPKKPWNIKLSGKKSILGMDKGKKWCILANSFDKSLMRNSLSYDMGLQNGVTYTCQSRFVEVYVNGTYNGNYLITEPVEAKKERVDIDAYNGDSNDILLELGTRYESDVNHFTTSTMKTIFDVNDPEKDDDLEEPYLTQKINRVNEYLSEFEKVLQGQNYEEILTYMDEDTFVDFYIVNELFKNVDFNYSSTRFYIKGNKIYAGPLWDFDLSSGNCKSTYWNYQDYYVDGVSYKGYYCQGMNWYKELFKNESFYNKVKERYKELQYVIQNIYKKGSETTLSIDNLVNAYGKSFERNYMSTDLLGAGWELTNDDGYSYAAESGWSTWEEPIEFLRDWLENRNIWLCGEWEIDMVSAYEESKPIEEPTTPEVTTQEPTSQEPVTEEPTSSEETSEVPTPGCVMPTTKPDETTKSDVSTTTKKSKVYVKKTKIKSASKKKSSKKAKISLKKVKGAKGYQVKISTSKKFKKKKTVTRYVKNIKFTIKSKKIKNKNKLYVKARAYKVVKGKKKFSDWCKAKKVKVTK